jgi:hypothetical protein
MKKTATILLVMTVFIIGTSSTSIGEVITLACGFDTICNPAGCNKHDFGTFVIVIDTTSRTWDGVPANFSDQTIVREYPTMHWPNSSFSCTLNRTINRYTKAIMEEQLCTEGFIKRMGTCEAKQKAW